MARDEKIKTQIKSCVKLTNARNKSECTPPGLNYLGTKYCVSICCMTILSKKIPIGILFDR